jgi:anti-sigma B factor antagonist
MRRFEVRDTGQGDVPGVALHGEIDIAVGPALEAALEDAIRESVGAFVIDLTDLDFIESTGLHILVRARALLSREDRALAIVCPHGPVRRAFELTGFSDLFVFFATREEVRDSAGTVDSGP